MAYLLGDQLLDADVLRVFENGNSEGDLHEKCEVLKQAYIQQAQHIRHLSSEVLRHERTISYLEQSVFALDRKRLKQEEKLSAQDRDLRNLSDRLTELERQEAPPDYTRSPLAAQ